MHLSRSRLARRLTVRVFQPLVDTFQKLDDLLRVALDGFHGIDAAGPQHLSEGS